MDGAHLPEYHSQLLRQKCFVDHVVDEEHFSGLRGHRTFWTTGTISLSTKLNAPPLQHALLPVGWQSSVSRQDVATHRVLSCRGYKRRLLAVELEALFGYRRGATAGLLAWATKDSDQAKITGFVASLESIEDERFAIMLKAVHVGMLREAFQVRGPTDSFFKPVDSTTGVSLDPVWATSATSVLVACSPCFLSLPPPQNSRCTAGKTVLLRVEQQHCCPLAYPSPPRRLRCFSSLHVATRIPHHQTTCSSSGTYVDVKKMARWRRIALRLQAASGSLGRRDQASLRRTIWHERILLEAHGSSWQLPLPE